MFCEATRHASVIRHPANFWSNLPYVYAALAMLVLGVDEARRGSNRPYQLADAAFGVVLLAMASASFAWHGSNCTAVHFVDIGLMNSVILYFPFRFGSSALFAYTGWEQGRWSALVGAMYVCLCAALLADALGNTERFHDAFPTGRARTPTTLTVYEVAMYVGAPGLYPLPSLALMAKKRVWGYLPAVAGCLLALPLGFVMHMCERLVLDLRCAPLSLWTQPTACFHALTGVAIMGAYVHARSLDDVP